MECRRCGNKDKQYFHEDGKGVYCRKCIMFGRFNLGDVLVPRVLDNVEKRAEMCLDYSLTKAQSKISKRLIETVVEGKSALVYAACGAGKTEIVMPLITYCINHKLRIGFAISRREVVLELTSRLANVFPMLEVIPVCEGYTSKDEGDLILCTTHQLYRYHKSFDVLILDEIDAFPYAGNPVLESIAMHASRTSVVYLTATPDHSLKEKVTDGTLELFELFSRPHGFPLIVPRVKKGQTWFQFLFVLKTLFEMKKENKPVLLFVPTISWTKRLHYLLSLHFKVDSISSKTEDKEEVMSKFQKGDIDVLVSTTILERGITITDVQVLVLMGDHVVFNEASLVQIIGRVGRKKEFPSGKAVIYCKKKTSDIRSCVKTLERMNEHG